METVYSEFSGELSSEILGLFSGVTGSCRALGATPGRAREDSEQRGPGCLPIASTTCLGFNRASWGESI